MGGPALARPALVLYHGLQPRVKPRGAGAPRSTGLGRQGRSRLRTKAILLDPDRGNDAGMSRSVPRADRDGVAGAPPLRCGGVRPAAGGDTEGVESRAAPMGAQQSRAATARDGIRRRRRGVYGKVILDSRAMVRILRTFLLLRFLLPF